MIQTVLTGLWQAIVAVSLVSAPAGQDEQGASMEEPAELIAWITECDQGDSVSCHNAATAYDNGEIVKEDRSKAATFFAKACDGDIGSGCTMPGASMSTETALRQTLRRASGCLTGHAPSISPEDASILP